MSVHSILEEIKKLTVIELSELVKSIETEFGVSAAAQATFVGAASDAGAGAAKSEEKNEYKVSMKSAGDQKIKVIKVLRTVLTTLGLKEAKDMVEGAPCVISESMPKKEALEFKAALEEAGAAIELL